jgi:hypothetical protein
MLGAIAPAPAQRPRIFTCGPTSFVGRVANLLVELGHDLRQSAPKTSAQWVNSATEHSLKRQRYSGLTR